MLISNEYFNIVDDEIHLRSPFAYKQECSSVHRFVKYNLSRATINECFRNNTIATVTNFASFYTGLNKWNQMFYATGIDSWESGKVCKQKFGQTKQCSQRW